MRWQGKRYCFNTLPIFLATMNIFWQIIECRFILVQLYSLSYFILVLICPFKLCIDSIVSADVKLELFDFHFLVGHVKLFCRNISRTLMPCNFTRNWRQSIWIIIHIVWCFAILLWFCIGGLYPLLDGNFTGTGTEH